MSLFMRVHILTFRYSATLGGFDDTPLVDFARDKEVIAFREHFYAVNEVPHLTCIVHYQDAVVPAEALAAAREIAPRAHAMHERARNERTACAPAGSDRFQRRDGAPDPCEGLSETERALFNHLREWRSTRAHEEGIPAYMILSNRQLVEVVRKRPDSPTALGHVHGLGPGKVQRYGAQILARLNGSAGTSRAECDGRDIDPSPPGPAVSMHASSKAEGQSRAGTDGTARNEPDASLNAEPPTSSPAPGELGAEDESAPGLLEPEGQPVPGAEAVGTL